MYFIFLFDLAPVLFTILILFFALMDQLVVVFPVLCWLFWILFAGYAALNVFLLFADEEHGIAEKIFIGMITIVSLVLMAIVSSNFFTELREVYGSGGIGGLFGFTVTLIFGGAMWLLAVSGLSYAAVGPIIADTEGKFVWSIIQSAIAIMLVLFFFL